ncbi:MAG: NAD(P)H-dependent oxidoreductase [Treponema sp.]|jgi:NAD(P)H dehydrogenase (quinone)|nr:NAD(P)H-dependent oxidoreductase [Treponema sp.]
MGGSSKGVFIVYAHPSEDSFTRHVRDEFIRGLESAGRRWILSDLYKMRFRTDMDESEYRREAFYRQDLPVPEDVLEEQRKINLSDGIAFIYPVFWSDAPAKLAGWFDRVWTYGFAYGIPENPAGNSITAEGTMKRLEKGLVICSAGNTAAYFRETGLGPAMEKVMLEDRLSNRVRHREMLILDAVSRENPQREARWDTHLQRVFEAGKAFFDTPE